MQALTRRVELQRDIAFGSNTVVQPLTLRIALILPAVRCLKRIRVQGRLHGSWHWTEIVPAIALMGSLIGRCNRSRTSGDIRVHHLGCLLVKRSTALGACRINRPDRSIVPIDFVSDHP
ncbi:hypothetical protein EBN15_12990 [Xanthomonas cucurbitae]|nr:hypothetical protein EBN15_12990 [Xanthomonas cucurbitae]